MSDKKIELPPDVIEADSKRPSYEDSRKPWRQEGEEDLYSLTFYKVQGSRIKDNWVILTLPIDNKGRSYVISLDGNCGRAGRGPHVKAIVMIHLHAGNADRLRKYIDLWKKGMSDAGSVRDRISSRRAEGQVRRANGERSWQWGY